MPSAEKERIRTRAAGASSIALVLVIAGMVNYMAARHFRRGDWTGAKMYSVSEKTRQIVGSLKKDVRVTVFMIPGNDVYQFTDELLQQFRRYAGGRLTVENIDVDKQRDQALLLARKYKIGGEDLREGVVVFESGEKTKYVTKNELVEYDYRETQMGGEDQKVRSFKGEGAFDSALLTVTEGEQTTVCFVKGHGEGEPESFEEAGYSAFAEELKRDNDQVKAIAGLGKAGVPRECAVVIVGGPQRAWDKAEVDALDRYLGGGGKALLLLGPLFDRDVRRFVRTGLEPLVENWGARLGDNIVVDVETAHPLEGPIVWATDSYTDHPIVKKMAGKVTFWPQAREVRAVGKEGLDAQELVRTSDKGWGEASLAVFRREEPLRFDAATDVKGPVPVAVACERRDKGTRLVVLGTPMLIENYRLKPDVVRDYNVDLALAAVGWLVKKTELVAVGPKQPEHIKLTLTDGQLHRAALLSILGLPLCGALLGGFVWWRRRS